MSVATAQRTWHVQTSLDPTAVALMCPWPACGSLSVVDPLLMLDQIGKTCHCRYCGLPAVIPDYREDRS